MALRWQDCIATYKNHEKRIDIFKGLNTNDESSRYK